MQMALLSEYTLADPEVAKCPFPYYAAMRSIDPVHQDPRTGWFFITHYDDVVAAAQDPGTFSSSTDLMFRQTFMPAARRILEDSGVTVEGTFTVLDPPAALDVHNIGNRLFPPIKVQTLLPHIREITEALLSEFIDRREAELALEYSQPLVATIICEELALPVEDRHKFRNWASCMGELNKIGITEEEEVKAAQKLVDLFHYLTACLERARNGIPGTVAHTIATANRRDGTPFTHNQKCWMYFLSFTSGNNTTVNMLNMSMLRLAVDQSLQAHLRAQPEQIDRYVEEMLRLEGSTQSIVRRTTRDVEVHGTIIPKDSNVLLSLGSANRDEAKWGADAAILRLDRTEYRRHVAFGSGLHSCAGMHLARAVLRTALETLLRRTSRLRLKDTEAAPDQVPLTFHRGISGLPVALERPG
jgi:cytochrome P450